MIKFTNGKTITNAEAAALIRKEPYGLIIFHLIDKDNHRCACGVIVNAQPLNSPFHNKHPWPTVDSFDIWSDMVNANNSFIGTPIERREYMARWFETRSD